jgi:hypothetical protein
MAEQSGQLDQISEAIGEIRGTVGGIERYIHDKRHDDANIAQKIEALGIRITRDIAAVEGRIEGQIKAMDDRLAAVEREQFRQDGAKNLIGWFLQSPLIGWLTAAIVIFAAWWKKL